MSASQPPESTHTRLKTRLIAAYVGLCNRRPFGVLLILLALCVSFGVLLPRIAVDPRLEALLPPETHTLQANAEARKRFAGASPYYMVVQSSDPAQNRQIAQRALEEVRKWPETLWAINRRDPSYFLERRLLFLDAPTLEQLADDIELYLDWQRCDKMPGCVNFEDEPPEPDFSVLERRFKELPELQALIGLFGQDTLPDPAAAKAPPTPEKGGAKGELCSSDGRVCVVQVTLDGDASNLAFATKMLHRGEALLQRLHPDDPPPDLITAVTGVYRNLPMTREAVMQDLTKTFGITMLLVVGILAIQFRKLRAFVLLLVPLLVGSVWALGLIAMLSPELNLISAAVLIVFAGLGIDFSLHLVTHYGSLRERGSGPVEALVHTLDELLTSLWVAALTTSVGFCSLMAGRFHGFSQMGMLAGVGIVCILVATLLVIPPLVLALDRFRPLTEALTRPWTPPSALLSPWPRRVALSVTLGGLMVFGTSIWLATQVRLEHDFSGLTTKAANHGTKYGPALHGTSRNFVLMLADDPASLEEAGKGLLARFPQGLSGREGPSVITPGTFIPPDQTARLEAIAKLRKQAGEAERLASGDVKHRIQAWQPLLAVDHPISRDDMPRWVVDSFAERDGSFGTVGLTYHSYNSENALDMVELTKKLELLRLTYPKVRFASTSAVLGEIMPLLSADGWRITFLTLGGLTLGVGLFGRSLRRIVLVLTAICMTVTCTAACMVLFGWNINLFNLLVFPVAFGMGVDGAIYVVWSVYRGRRVTDWSTLGVAMRSVWGATMTTLVAFGSLSFSSSGGLSSLGKLAGVALAISLTVNLLWLPAALSLLHHRAARRLT